MRKKQRVLCLNTGTVYGSASEAAAAAGVDKSMMSRHLRGHYKSVKKQIYVYYTLDQDPTPAQLAAITKAYINRCFGLEV